MATGTSVAINTNREWLFRLQTLLIDGGTEVLRNLFDQRLHGVALGVVLAREQKTIRVLKQHKTITKAQYDLLYPPSGQQSNSKDFDITLIICLLRNLPFLGLNQNYSWNVYPQPTDLSLEADLCRLREFRNEVAHISTTFGFKQASFYAKWTEIEQILLRLNSTVPYPLPNFQTAIDSYKFDQLDPSAEQRVKSIIEQWQQMERGLDTEMRLIKNDIKSLNLDSSDTKRDVKNIERTVRDTQQDVTNIGQTVRDTKQDVTNIGQTVRDTKQDVTNIGQTVRDTKQDVTNIGQTVRDTQRDVTDIGQTVRDTKQDVTNIEQTVRDTKQDVINIGQTVRDTKQDVINIGQTVRDTKQDVQNIEQEVSDTKQHVQLIQQTVDVIKKDIQHITKAASTREDAHHAHAELKSNLQSDLISLYKRHHKIIHLSPLMKEDQPLLDFYVMPDLQTITVTRYPDGNIEKKTCVTSLRDVFFKENKLCSNIYLTADAGLGKTAFSKRLALTWCHSIKPDKSDNKHFRNDDISSMHAFSFMFLVFLRDCSDECDTDMLIMNQICSQLAHVFDLESLRKILHEETCLIVLDGLDEWTHPSNACSQGESSIPHHRVRENVAVLTTTRPWKLSVTGLHSSHIDKQLELNGLSNNSAKKLKRSVISYLYEEQDESKIDKYEVNFNKNMQERHKSDLTAIPLFLIYFLFQWYYKVNTGKSLADLYCSITELLLSRTVQKEDGIHIPNTETAQDNIPSCFLSNKLCTSFFTLLISLGKLAFHTLFSKTKEGSAVEKYLKDDLTFCLNTGIITQSEIKEDSLFGQKTKVSFAHKTIQEFFAALYICCTPEQRSVQEMVWSKCRYVKDILDMSKIFLFIVGMDGKFSFSRELMKIINEDGSTHEYRRSLQDNVLFCPLQEIQNMYISCYKEMPRGNGVNFCLQDVFIDRTCKQEEYRENLKQLTLRNNQIIVSLYINTNGMRNRSCKVIDDLALSDLFNIEKIDYRGEYSDNVILTLLNNKIQCLSLSCWRKQGFWSNCLFDKVKSLQELDVIRFSGFNISRSELSLLLDYISNRDCLREVMLEGLMCPEQKQYCSELSLDLSRHLSLRKLTLGLLNLSRVTINIASLEDCRLQHLKGLSARDCVLKFRNFPVNNLKTFHCNGRLKLCKVTMEASSFRELFDAVLKLKHAVTVGIDHCTISPTKAFETLKRKMKTSQRVKILKDEENMFEFETVQDGD